MCAVYKSVAIPKKKRKKTHGSNGGGGYLDPPPGSATGDVVLVVVVVSMSHISIDMMHQCIISILQNDVNDVNVCKNIRVTSQNDKSLCNKPVCGNVCSDRV